MAKKVLDESNFWAQHIIRAQQDGKDCIFALVRRKYSEDDIEQVGSGEYRGLSKEAAYLKITDPDPDSETFGKRISKPNSEPTGMKMIYTDKFTPENIKKYKSMCGITNFGQTEYIYKFKQVNISADKLDEFWSIPQDEAYDKYVLNTREIVVKVEKDKPNVKRRNP